MRSANSGPIGASSGFELLSVPRVRPIPALEEDILRKSRGFASAGMWLVLVGWELLVGWRVEWTVGAGALLYTSAKEGILMACLIPIYRVLADDGC